MTAENLSKEECKRLHDLIRQCAEKTIKPPPKKWWQKIFDFFQKKGEVNVKRKPVSPHATIQCISTTESHEEESLVSTDRSAE